MKMPFSQPQLLHVKGHLARGLFLLLLTTACTPKQKPQTAFYYWKTSYRTTPQTEAIQQQLNSKKLYLRLCDIGWDEVRNEAVPQDGLRPAEPLPKDRQTVPVIFIEMPVLQKLHADTDAIQPLAANLARYVQKTSSLYGREMPEIQIDCDWTATTSATYFQLLRHLRTQPFMAGKILSVTLRLHQVKYLNKAGIPPVDRCMLMCYNLGRFKTRSSENSILDVATAKDYLQNLSGYPLPLDLALPVFRWTLWYRNDQLLGILRNTDPQNLIHTSFLKSTKNTNLYRCVKDTFWNGYALQNGDFLKAEAPSPEDVGEIAAFATARMPLRPYTIAFYHLDPSNIAVYDRSQLEKILRRCQ